MSLEGRTLGTVHGRHEVTAARRVHEENPFARRSFPCSTLQKPAVCAVISASYLPRIIFYPCRA
jgi:hypothetical protein